MKKYLLALLLLIEGFPAYAQGVIGPVGPGPVPPPAQVSFLPTFTFGTVGDLSVSYGTQTGSYSVFGPIVFFKLNLVFTPTYTTSSGNALISISAIGINNGTGAGAVSCSVQLNAGTYPVGTTQIYSILASGGATITLFAVGSSVGSANLSTTSIPSAASRTFNCQGFYYRT